MEKAPLNMQQLARKDQAKSKRHCYSVWEIPTKDGRREIHTRSWRKQVVLRSPDGDLSVLGSKDIVHDYDTEGRLTRRFTVENPPPEFEKISQEELQSYLRQ